MGHQVGSSHSIHPCQTGWSSGLRKGVKVCEWSPGMCDGGRGWRVADLKEVWMLACLVVA